MGSDPPVCVECGNDHAVEGYVLCSDCLPVFGSAYPNGGRRE